MNLNDAIFWRWKEKGEVTWSLCYVCELRAGLVRLSDIRNSLFGAWVDPDEIDWRKAE